MAASVCVRPARSGGNPLVLASGRVFAISRGTSFALRTQCSIWWGRRELRLLVWYGETLVPSIVLTVYLFGFVTRLIYIVAIAFTTMSIHLLYYSVYSHLVIIQTPPLQIHHHYFFLFSLWNNPFPQTLCRLLDTSSPGPQNHRSSD